jgi:hypothetical protein
LFHSKRPDKIREAHSDTLQKNVRVTSRSSHGFIAALCRVTPVMTARIVLSGADFYLDVFQPLSVPTTFSNQERWRSFCCMLTRYLWTIASWQERGIKISCVVGVHYPENPKNFGLIGLETGDRWANKSLQAKSKPIMVISDHCPTKQVL